MGLGAVFEQEQALPVGEPPQQIDARAGWPYRCTGTMALVRGVTAAAAAFTSIV